MEAVKGFRGKLAIKQGAAWGTVVVADKRLRFTQESLAPQIDLVDDDSLDGDNGHNDSVQGVEKLEGAISIPMQYGGNADMILAALMGASATKAGAPQSHFRWNFDLLEPSDFFTLALQKGGEIHEFASMMPISGELSCEIGKAMVFSPTFRGRGYSDVSATNTTTTMSAAAKSSAPKILWSHFKYFLGDNADALDVALPSTDEIKLRKFSLKIDQQMDDAQANDGLLLPRQSNRRNITLDLGLDRLDVTTYRTWLRAKTHLQFSAMATVTVGAITFYFSLNLGKLFVTSVPDSLGGPELIKPDISLVARRADSTSLTWATQTEELTIETQNDGQATNPLT